MLFSSHFIKYNYHIQEYQGFTLYHPNHKYIILGYLYLFYLNIKVSKEIEFSFLVKIIDILFSLFSIF